MTPEQFQQLLAAVSAGHGLDWVQGALALGATLVSVTGVVVGMRAAISTLAGQVKDQREAFSALSLELHEMAKQLAVLKYAMGVDTKKGEE